MYLPFQNDIYFLYRKFIKIYIVSHEIIQYLHKNKGPKGFMAIKLILQKHLTELNIAFLSVYIFKQFGFHS